LAAYGGAVTTLMINWVGVGPSNVHEVVTHVVVSELSRVQDLTAAAAAAATTAAAATASVRVRRTMQHIVVAKEQGVVETLAPGVGVDAHHLTRLSLVSVPSLFGRGEVADASAGVTDETEPHKNEG